MTYIRADSAEVDAWEHLGNPGWNWEALLPFYKKSENSTIPTASQLAAGATYEREYHGFDGPIRTGYTTALKNGSFGPAITGTWDGLALPHCPDLNAGDVRGYSMGPQTIDPQQALRWDAARAYYYPVEDRPNLKIVQGTAKRITWAETAEARKRKSCDGGKRLIANGVEYVTDDGKTEVLGVGKEVVVSAGAARTPLVLEGSGIGNPR